MSNLSLFCDNLIEANWFKGLHKNFQSASVQTINARGQNPDIIDEIISYDRPDIILLQDDKPVLVVEKTREVPTGHNVGQRIARLVRAIELGIPTIKYFPFDARKHGQYSSMCNLNARLLLAFEKMWDIHSTPLVAINWPSDEDGELISDGTEDDELKDMMSSFVKDGYCSGRAFLAQKEKMKENYGQRVQRKPQYQTPPPSVTIEATASFFQPRKEFLSPVDLKKIKAKDESVVYKIVMTEANCRREDPYTGTQFIYDYLYCRTGPKPEEKSRNLVLWFPDIRKQVWLQKNPNDHSRKSCNWYLIASALVFKDGSIYLR